MRHFACNTLNTTVFLILLLTLCASLEYNCLNPGIFTILSTIRVMLLMLYLALYCQLNENCSFYKYLNPKENKTKGADQG